MHSLQILSPDSWTTYELVDSGDGEKLESFAGYRIIRPDPRILWNKHKPDQWNTYDARFIREGETTRWDIRTPVPNPWILTYGDMSFLLEPTDFKHVGIFPEQAANWNWLRKQCTGQSRPLSVLNLFGYTGAATVACAKEGCSVTHVDSSKPALSWAHENCTRNGIPETLLRWIPEDAETFVTRETKRGNTYDGIVLDPPRFGRGSKGQVFKIEDDLPRLLDGCFRLLSDHPVFFLVNAYTADLSSLVIAHLLAPLANRFPSEITAGELAIAESGADGRLVPHGIFARIGTHE